MAKKIESWQAEDGLVWVTELECVAYECLVDLFTRVPGLKDRDAIIRSHVQDIANALHPLGLLLNPPAESLASRVKDWEVMPLPSGDRLEIISAENHPEVPEENHPKLLDADNTPHNFCGSFNTCHKCGNTMDHPVHGLTDA